MTIDISMKDDIEIV